MPTIVAICPYCRAGGVRAPQTNIGACATCPKCGSSFTVMPTDGLPGWQKEAQPASTQSSPQPAIEETRPTAAMGMADVTEPSPVLTDRDTPRSEPATAPGATDEAVESRGGALVLALAALILVGVAVAAMQFPNGRVAAASVAGLGLVAGFISFGAGGRASLAGGLAIGLNGAILSLVLLAPSWLIVQSGQAPADTPQPAGPLAVDHRTGSPSPVTPGDWLDAARHSWRHNDVLVTIRSASIGSNDVGLRDANRASKEQYLHIQLRVKNESAVRDIDLWGWAIGRANDEVRVSDPSGKTLKEATSGLSKRLDHGKPLGHLFPGSSSEPRLHFAVPAPTPEWFHVRLPGSAVGVPNEEIRFRISREFLGQVR